MIMFKKAVMFINKQSLLLNNLIKPQEMIVTHKSF